MYPNPQDVLPLPSRPDLRQYRTRAKDLVAACRSAEPDVAVRAWAARWIDDLARHVPERDAGDLRSHAGRRAEQVAEFARARLAPDCALNQAQFVIARAHGFESWPRLAAHLESLAGAASPASTFERAADAIVSGDVATLEQLLAADPALIRARSAREHRATLLHYVAANGVENYRQRTPPNIVEITRRLLDAGADVNAEADVYGGGATTLGLVVTSAHPRAAGVQNELADLLLDRGARMENGLLRACLLNGCPEAAAHLVSRGASLSLETAAGLGMLGAVRQAYEGAPPSRKDGLAALGMAAWYGRSEVVEFLLDQGLDPGSRLDEDSGETPLHVAAYEGHTDLVELLVARGAPVNVTDKAYGTPPFVWALHAWLVENRGGAGRYRAVLMCLARAGAEVRPEWLDDDRVRTDPELAELVSGR